MRLSPPLPPIMATPLAKTWWAYAIVSLAVVVVAALTYVVGGVPGTGPSPARAVTGAQGAPVESTVALEVPGAAEAAVGTPLTVTARVFPPEAIGLVKFTIVYWAGGHNMERDVPLQDGVASFETAFPLGEHEIRAVFVPAAPQWHTFSSAETMVRIREEITHTSLELATSEVTAGGTVTATATVSPDGATPWAEVEFRVGESTQRVRVAGRSATARLPVGDAGPAVVTATFYPFDYARYAESSDRRTVSVVAEATDLGLTTSPEPVLGEPTSLSARITPGAAGTVTFSVDGEEYVVTVIDGAAATGHIFRSVGDHTVRAQFAPANPGRYSGSANETTVVIEPKSAGPGLGTPETPAFGSLGSLVGGGGAR